MREILRELEGYTGDAPATATEVERVKLNRTRSLPGSFATNAGFLSSIANSDAYGLPFDHAETAADRIAAVTTDGVAERARIARAGRADVRHVGSVGDAVRRGSGRQGPEHDPFRDARCRSRGCGH